MKQFFKEALQTFSPSYWEEISKRPSGQGIGFFSKVLLFAFLIMILLYIPAMIKLPSTISENLNKFDTLQMAGNFTMSSPIKLPRADPLFVLDTSGAYDEPREERLLITEKSIYYRPLFKTYSMATSSLKDLKENSSQTRIFLAMLTIFILPAVLFWAYLMIWVKYFLLILITSIIVFLLLDLTHWRRTWAEVFVITSYVSILPVLAEIIVGTINKDWLIPIFGIAGIVKLYLIPIVILVVLSIGASICVYYNKKEK